IVIFLAIAQGTDMQTATGAVILTALFYFIALPFFTRVLRFFPPIVIGTMLLLVAVNLVKIFGSLIVGQPDSPSYAASSTTLLALATMAAIVLCARLFRGVLRRISVMLGLLSGTLIAALFGNIDLSGMTSGPWWALPQLFPFGMPKFDIIASLPLIIFSVVSM